VLINTPNPSGITVDAEIRVDCTMAYRSTDLVKATTTRRTRHAGKRCSSRSNGFGGRFLLSTVERTTFPVWSIGAQS